MVDNQHWLERWHDNRIGFHEATVNRHLQTYLPSFELAPGSRVFLPLCGKALDINWLAQQDFDVIGIELSRIAVEAFFDENELTVERHSGDRFSVYRAGNITLLQGDFYDLNADDLSGCQLVYDRAAMIAIEAQDRPRYCEQMLRIMPSQCHMLLVTLTYQQTQMQGPPFSVSDDEVYQCYRDRFAIERLDISDILDERPRWRQQGLGALSESVFRLEA